MRLAAIDIGTNSVRLLISELTGAEAPKTIVRETSITRLGEEVNKNHQLKLEAMERTLSVLGSYKNEIARYQAAQVRVTATSAVREGQNSNYFLSKTSQELGLQVEVLSGREEAKLAFWGTLSDPHLAANHYQLVTDVGGGSTELALGESSYLSNLVSLDIGSVRLTEAFIKNDPPTSSELDTISYYVRSILSRSAPFILDKEDIATIGVAGTATTLSAIHQNLALYDSTKIHRSTLSLAEIEELLKKLISVPLGQRREITGLEPKRADVIITGTVIFLEILKAAGSDKLIVSERDMLDGLILSQIPGRTSPGIGIRQLDT